MPRRIGLDFIMRGYKMDARTAQQHGLATEVVPAAQLDARVAELAQELMAFDEAIPFLKEMLDKSLKTADAKEGITAFLEKRKPVWKGC